MYREAKGGAWIEGKVGSRNGTRRRQGTLARIRSGTNTRKKAEWWRPRFPGPPSAAKAENTQNFYYTPGSVSSDQPDRGWLFAITPERYLGASQSIDPESDNSAQYQVAGIKGTLMYTPLLSLNDQVGDPGKNSGYVEMYWYKLRIMPYAGRLSTLTDQTQSYPWASWEDPADTGLTHVDGYLPQVGIAPANQQGRDARWRSDVMFHCRIPWSIERNVYYDVVQDVIGEEVTKQIPIRLPLPRKVVCNVGRGECLAACYQVVSHSQTNAASSPVGVFTSDLKVKVFEV